MVKIFRHAFGGRTHGLDYFTKGDLVGEECIFSDSPRTNEAVAYEDVTALAVEKSVFIELGQRNQWFWSELAGRSPKKKEQWHFPVVPDGTRVWPACFCAWRRNLGFETVVELFESETYPPRDGVDHWCLKRDRQLRNIGTAQRGIIQADGKRCFC